MKSTPPDKTSKPSRPCSFACSKKIVDIKIEKKKVGFNKEHSQKETKDKGEKANLKELSYEYYSVSIRLTVRYARLNESNDPFSLAGDA